MKTRTLCLVGNFLFDGIGYSLRVFGYMWSLPVSEAFFIFGGEGRGGVPCNLCRLAT